MNHWAFKMFFQICFTAIVLFGTISTFATEDEKRLLVIKDISIKGNEKTNDKIILRELTFRLEDTICIAELNDNLTQSIQNLNNTLLFNFVYINHNYEGNGNLQIEVIVEERWYFWPFPIFEHSHRNLSAFFNDGDLSRVNYGVYFTIDNFRGLREQIKLRFVWGYRKELKLQYFSLNLDKEKKHGISGLVSYQTNYEVPFQSIKNKPIYYSNGQADARRVFNTSISYRYRPKHNWYQSVTFGWINANVSDTIAKLNPNYFGNSLNKFIISEIKYETLYDKRDSKIFPLQGYFGKAEIARQGIFNSESIANWNVKLWSGFYSKITERLYTGSDITVQLNSENNLPYYISEAIGYKNHIRGMEYYTTNGQNFVLNKNSLKFQLLKAKVVTLSLLPEGKFKKTHLSLFWSIFADTGFVKPDQRTLPDDFEGKFLYGYGTGLYLYAYYDIVFRVEYSINLLGEKGFFIHLGTPFLKF